MRISSTNSFVESAKGIRTILSNVGINDPVLNNAVNYASVASAAMSQALTGNYIGAIVSVTGVFGGGKPDPQQQQFAATMAALRRLDEKLTQVINLQKKTLEAIQGLSNQVADLEKTFNVRLDRVDFELKTISENLKIALWEPYLACNTAWVDSADVFDESVILNFRNATDLMKYANGSARNAIKCARALDDLFLSPKRHNVFGGLLSLNTAVHTDYSLNPSDSGNVLTETDLKQFRDTIHIKAQTVALSGWKHKWGAGAALGGGHLAKSLRPQLHLLGRTVHALSASPRP
jgi:hypothetical protein